MNLRLFSRLLDRQTPDVTRRINKRFYIYNKLCWDLNRLYFNRVVDLWVIKGILYHIVHEKTKSSYWQIATMINVNGSWRTLNSQKPVQFTAACWYKPIWSRSSVITHFGLGLFNTEYWGENICFSWIFGSILRLSMTNIGREKFPFSMFYHSPLLWLRTWFLFL